MVQADVAESELAVATEAAKKEQMFKGVCFLWFSAVVAHCLNLQSEAILFRDACGGDLAKAARLVASSNAAAGILGVFVNQMGGKLSDSLGRKPFYSLGPSVQILTGFVAYMNSRNPLVLAIAKTVRMVATTFSGTVMGTAGLRDMFQGQEMAVRSSKAVSVIGVAIMVGPFLEGLLLKRAKSGKESITYLALMALGLVSLVTNSVMLPESLPPTKRKELNVAAVIAGANPFGFTKIYTQGTPLLKRLATITAMQTMIDGKNMSDLGMIWMREHLKMSVEGIRNFVMTYGLLNMVVGAKLTPALLKGMSVQGFTAFTNATNLIAFILRGATENVIYYLAAVPLMLPGVNGVSNSALVPIVNKEFVASGFGVGESTAWLNNLRVLAGAVATLAYGNCYAFCQKRGLHAGSAYILAGLLGAALPQALLTLSVSAKDLEPETDKAK